MSFATNNFVLFSSSCASSVILDGSVDKNALMKKENVIEESNQLEMTEACRGQEKKEEI